jgi:hypothetical protein
MREVVSTVRTGLTLAAAIVCIACCWVFFTAQPAWLFEKATPVQHSGLIILTGALGALLVLRILRSDIRE